MKKATNFAPDGWGDIIGYFAEDCAGLLSFLWFPHLFPITFAVLGMIFIIEMATTIYFLIGKHAYISLIIS